MLIALLVLAGCSMSEFIDQRVSELGDVSPHYREGYRDGCRSVLVARSPGHSLNERIRDDARMRGDADYSLGWNDGWRRCDSGPGTTVLMTD